MLASFKWFICGIRMDESSYVKSKNKYRGSLIVDYGGHRSAAQNAQMEAATNVNQRVAAYRVPAYKHHGTALSYFFL